MSDSSHRSTPPPPGTIPPPRRDSEHPVADNEFRAGQPPLETAPPPFSPPPPEPTRTDSARPSQAPEGRRGSQAPEGRRHDEDRSPFERILPELIKRGLEASRGTIGNVSDTLFSRDLANSVISQLGDVREGLVSAVAQEVGRFLRQADIAAEIRNVLTGMEVEAQVKIKFRKADDGGVTTQVEIEDPPKRGRRWRG